MSKRALEDVYQKKTQHEHILTRPDMYIGTIEPVTEEMWVFDEGTQLMTQRTCTWIPGLYKIFDEILVNAADNKQRDESQTAIKVYIDQEKGMVRVWNNGEGIPVAMHQKYNIWIPELIFGHLLTSSNYNDGEKKVTGGRNGFGAKLTNVFSKRFEVETLHAASRKKFKMVWRNNMLEHDEPIITSVGPDEKDYTQVTFYPEFARFNVTEFSEDSILLMKRRVYDIAGCTPSSMKCYLNGTKLPVSVFSDYVDLYPTFGEEKSAKSYIRVNDRWEVCVRVSNIGYQQVSFVNSIATTRGGNHVRYVTDQIVAKVAEQAKKKSKVEVKAHMIKQHLWVFVNCLIENPGFDSQTKETLNTTRARFGSSCELPDKFIDYILKTGIVERAVTVANSKLTREMAAKIKSSDRKRILGIPKLEDANDAGGKHSSECTLILTEGDSAKALCMAGLSVVGKDRFGVFPLRGKPLNVREASLKKITDCEEIQSVMKIIGLDVRVKYTSVEGLRYGHVMIMSDQDCDGSHIKGLIINMFQHFWPGLYAIPGFLQQFITPIVRVWLPSRRDQKRSFYSMPEYLRWKESLTSQQLSRYSIRYFKGLGTSEPADGREYFSNIAIHRLQFVRRDDRDDERVVMAFSKDKIEERKQWITAFRGVEMNPEALMDYTVHTVPYSDFIDKELILFSIADCERSIPSVVDGLKPGQRKILFSCFKRNLTRSIKVSQLSGYVSEQSAYHHGEASLHSTIVGMAQDFVGANNLPLLKPEGTFGSRLAGGKDHAAPRYIFTSLADFTRLIFNKNDDFILTYRDDDGLSVEPHHYVPVIPFVLVNGTSGIGTGFATSIPNFNPLDVIDNCRRLLRGDELRSMVPWYYGFKGNIVEKEKGKFVSQGKYTIQHDGVISITELPIGMWTNQFKKLLEELLEKELILTVRENNSDSAIDTDILLHPEVLASWRDQGVLEEKLGLNSYVHASNIIAFDANGQLKKYADADAVLREFYELRLSYYERRKEYLLRELEYDRSKLSNMVRFITEVVDGRLIVTRRPKKELLEELQERRYRPFPPRQKKKVSSTTIQIEGEQRDAENAGDDAESTVESRIRQMGGGAEDDGLGTSARDYDYLLSMKIWSLTKEMVEYLQEQLRKAETDLRTLECTSIKDLWMRDLDILEEGVKKYFLQRDSALEMEIRKRSTKRPLVVAKVRIPLLSDKARALIKPVGKATRVSKSADGSVTTEDAGGKPRKPKRKRVKDEDDGAADFEDWDGFGSDSESMSSPSNPPKERKATSKPSAPRMANGNGVVKKAKEEEKSGFDLFAGDDDPFASFGLGSAVKKPQNLSLASRANPRGSSKKIELKPMTAVSPTAYSATDSPSDSGVGAIPFTSAPAHTAPSSKPPAPRRNINIFDDDDELLFGNTGGAVDEKTTKAVVDNEDNKPVKTTARTAKKETSVSKTKQTKSKSKKKNKLSDSSDDEDFEDESDSDDDDLDESESDDDEDWD